MNPELSCIQCAQWHESAAKYGWGAFASLSLIKKNAVVGRLMLYADTPNAFDEEARKLLLEMAENTSFAISNFAYASEAIYYPPKGQYLAIATS